MTVQLDGAGNCIEVEDGIAAIGSGGLYALSAARGMIDNEELCAKEIALRAMKIAGDLCVYTNHTTTMEVLSLDRLKTTGADCRPLVGYWDCRGKGAQVLYILAYCGVDYDHKVYKRGPPPEFSKSAWQSHRDELAMDFPNLPYLIDGDVKLSESKSLMKYVAKKYDPQLLGRNAEEMAKADMVSRVHDDLYDRIGKHFKNGVPEKFYGELDVVGQILANFLGEDKKFMTGANLTFVDFSVFELLDFMNIYSEGATFAKYANLRRFHERITRLPRFCDAWADNSKLIKEPFKYGQMAAIAMSI